MLFCLTMSKDIPTPKPATVNRHRGENFGKVDSLFLNHEFGSDVDYVTISTTTSIAFQARVQARQLALHMGQGLHLPLLVYKGTISEGFYEVPSITKLIIQHLKEA